MHDSLRQLNLVQNKVNDIINKKQLKIVAKIIVITKTFPLNKIIPLLEHGHTHFGENKIQEAEYKWVKAKNQYKNLQLHMVGKLQSNKVKKALELFDYIHSLDNERLALKISKYEKELGKKINIGEVLIVTGDYIIGDDDGIVIIPEGIAEKIIIKAENDMTSENKIRDAILNGVDPQKAYLKYGKF